MIVTQPSRLPAHLKDIHLLARLLERLENSTTEVAPSQYRQVVRSLARALDSVPHDAALHAVIDVFPAATQLYENLRYGSAGLCRAPRAAARSAQALARQALDEAAASSRQALQPPPAKRPRRSRRG